MSSDVTLLKISADLGASRTKLFWSLSQSQGELSGFKSISSAVEEVTASAYANGRYRDQGTSYIRIGDECWLVGASAQQEPAIASEPKSTHAIAKVLMAVGAVLREIPEGLEPTFELHLLLPYDEMDDSAALQSRLTTLFYDGFGFDGNKIKIRSVRTCSIHPEGYGMSQCLSKSPAVIFMLGHRDNAVLPVEGNRVVGSECVSFSGMGMIQLLKKTEFVFKDELRAAAAIFAAGDQLLDKHLLKIASERDLPRLKSALSEARVLYWRDMVRRLQVTPFKAAEQVLACGGNAYYWRSELKELLGSRLTLGANLMKEMQEQYPDLAGSALSIRMLNAYALSRTIEGALIHA